MIPLSLVTGFLGSGKTTLLRRIVERHRGRRIVYLVNEFSSQDVDGAMLDENGTDVVTIPGGSIFCRCLVTEFLRHLTSIPECFGSADAPVDGVVIEASGIADPLVIRRMLVETHLDTVYRLATIISVVEPASFLKLVHTLPNIIVQVQSADLVLVNKADLASDAQRDATLERIREINPTARVLQTAYCDVAFDPFDAGSVSTRDGEYARCVDPNYGRLELTFDAPANVDEIERALRSVADDVYRAKGFIPTDGGDAYFDFSGSGLLVIPHDRKSAAHALAIIVRGGAEQNVRDALSGLSGCRLLG